MNRKEKNGVKALPFSRLREQCGKKTMPVNQSESNNLSFTMGDANCEKKILEDVVDVMRAPDQRTRFRIEPSEHVIAHHKQKKIQAEIDHHTNVDPDQTVSELARIADCGK